MSCFDMAIRYTWKLLISLYMWVSLKAKGYKFMRENMIFHNLAPQVSAFSHLSISNAASNCAPVFMLIYPGFFDTKLEKYTTQDIA